MEKLIRALQGAVPPDGAFAVSVSSGIHSEEIHERQGSFFIALALRALTDVPGVEDVAERLSRRLLGEMKAEGTWNYWLRASSGAVEAPYPDDLDTTSIAMHALWMYNADFLTGTKLAQYVKLLMTMQVETGGPYGTWLNDRAQTWRDVDPTVNAHIYAFLGDQDITLPGLSAYLKSVLSAKREQSPFYPNRVAFLSALSYANNPAWHDELLAEVTARFRGAADPIDYARLLNALVQLKADVALLEQGQDELKKMVEDGRAFLAYPVCLDIPRGGQAFSASAHVVTMAMVLGALTRVEIELGKRERIKPEERVGILQTAIKDAAEERFSRLDPALAASAHYNIEELLNSDTHGEKTLFPYFVASSLGRADEIPEEFFVDACLAHTLGWIAYTIYDNVIDGESDPQDLPVANVALRELTHIFSQLVEPEALTDTMDRVDSANAWEVSKCRLKKENGRYVFPAILPHFGRGEKLVDRSWGIVLAARAVFLKLGFAPDGGELKAFEQYLTHFILAKRLMDDARDWEADLKRGQLTQVNTDVLERLRTRGFDITRPDWMQVHGQEMERLYWFESIERTCADVFFHVELAGEACEDMPEVCRTFWRALVANFAAQARKALQERDRTVEFLSKMKA